MRTEPVSTPSAARRLDSVAQPIQPKIPGETAVIARNGFNRDRTMKEPFAQQRNGHGADVGARVNQQPAAEFMQVAEQRHRPVDERVFKLPFEEERAAQSEVFVAVAQPTVPGASQE